MKTWEFVWNEGNIHIEAEDIFGAMVEFHAHYNGVEMEALLITVFK